MAKKEKKKHLGRGLQSLMGPITSIDVSQNVGDEANNAVNLPPDKNLRNASQTVSLEKIKPNPYQPRKTWNQEELVELTNSIKANGVIQPVLLRMVDGHFELIAGERRFRASKAAGLTEIPALVRDATDEEMLELALVENIHRSDLNPVERAQAYYQYIQSFSLNQTQAAERLGENRSVVANYLRLLDLPQEIQDMLVEGSLSMGHARAILALPTDELRNKLANRAMAGRLSVREVERLIRLQLNRTEEPKPQGHAAKPAHILDLERKLRDSLGTKVRIDARKKGQRGKIIVDYYSLDDFDRLTEIMGLEHNSEM